MSATPVHTVPAAPKRAAFPGGLPDLGTAAATSVKRRIRNGALGLACLALAFYLGFIVLLVSRSHH